MANEDIAIKVDGVSKDFLLPHERTQSVKTAFINALKGKRNKTIQKQHALKDVSFEVKKGEFFGIVGRNGSGKSTMLKILAQIYQPTKGSVQVNGRLVPFIELGVGFNPELTGRDNVYLSASLLGFSEREIDKMYDDIVAFAELEKFMDQKLKNYSSGMQVRLAFSVAVRADADVLLIDEVLAVGDADFQQKCFDFFKLLKQRKKTVIFVSHDMSAVQQYCDRAVLIEDSQLVLADSSRVVAGEYSRMLLGQPSSRGKNISTTPSGEPRWGDGTAVIKSVRVTKEADRRLVVKVKVKFLADTEVPIYGFSVKDSSFTQLIGTNNVRRSATIKPAKKNETRSFEWVIPNIFNRGVHYVDCTIAHDQPSSVSDRWPDAASFNNFREEDNPYPVYSPDIQFNQQERSNES